MIILELLRQFNLNPFGAKDAAFVITVASGSWTTGNGIAVGGKAAGKQVNAFPAEVKHWHGAAKDSWMQHLTYHQDVQEGASNEWQEAVTDEIYNQLK